MRPARREFEGDTMSLETIALLALTFGLIAAHISWGKRP
jgi:hypothetical protein